MATLNWNLTNTLGSVDFAGPEISDANMDRFIAWCLYQFPQLDGEGNPMPVTNAVKAAAFRDYAAEQWRMAKANVLRWEAREAAQSVMEGGDIEA